VLDMKHTTAARSNCTTLDAKTHWHYYCTSSLALLPCLLWFALCLALSQPANQHACLRTQKTSTQTSTALWQHSLLSKV
jgi:hypothetical protein